MGYDPDREIMVTVGGSEAIDIALRAMLDPGDEVLIPQPSYVSYVPCTILAGGVPVTVELEKRTGSASQRKRCWKSSHLKPRSWCFHFPTIPLALSWRRRIWRRSPTWSAEKDLFGDLR